VTPPAGVPKTLVAKLSADLVKTLNLPDVKERMAQRGADPAPTTPEQFAAFQKSEIAKWAQVVKTTGARAD
jgi:tripartite-type tricarboxylate transporter receptor subunit TctC